jgi:CBS domain-containing membrane protein
MRSGSADLQPRSAAAPATAKPLAVVLGVLGIGLHPIRWRDAVFSGVGGCVAIAAIFGVCRTFVGMEGAGLLVASMGASAVLLFALPEGPLSQPWAVIGGHTSSAVVGVLCASGVADPLFAAALAVGAAIGVMQLLRCVHPPGGATALSAVVGGSGVQALGMNYVLTPVLLNAVIIVAVAVAFNALLARRRYPAYLARTAPSAALVSTALASTDSAQ